MKTEQITGEIAEYQGRTDWPGFTFPIKFSGSVELFENVAELKAADAFPSGEDILKMVNDKRKAGEKAKLYQAEVKTLKGQYESSDDYKIKNFVASAKLAGLDMATVETILAKQYPNTELTSYLR